MNGEPELRDGLEVWNRDRDGRDVWSLTFRDRTVYVTLDGCDIQKAVINGRRWVLSDEPLYAGFDGIQVRDGLDQHDERGEPA